MRFLLLVPLLVSGCATSPTPSTTAGTVSLDPSYSLEAPIRVQWGQLWEHPEQVVDARDGRFALPAPARHATAFVDLDEDGRLDRFYEPAARCDRRGGGWQCPIPRASVFVQRYTRQAPDETVDKVIAGAEAFLESGVVDWAPMLCTEAGDCAQPTAGPFDTGAGRLLALCELDGDGATSANVNFAGATHIATKPPPIVADVRRARQEDGTVVVRAHFDGPVDRAIVWLGTVAETGELAARLWDSEQAVAGVLSDSSFTVTIPAAAVAACDGSDCLVTVQLARPSPGSLPTLSLFEGSLAL